MAKKKAGAKFSLIEPGSEPYALMHELIGAHHSDLAVAEIALVWLHEVKEDRDGHILWGRAKKVSALERTFHPHDFVIQLNMRVWQELPEVARRALMDHELSHCGSEVSDTTGEVKWILHKHDVEDFIHVVRRYGLWKADVEAFVNAALKREQKDLFPGEAKAAIDSLRAQATVTS